MKVKSESEVAQSSPTLSDPMDCSLSGSSIHGIFQARVLEWDAIAFSMINDYMQLKLGEKKLCTLLVEMYSHYGKYHGGYSKSNALLIIYLKEVK